MTPTQIAKKIADEVKQLVQKELDNVNEINNLDIIHYLKPNSLYEDDRVRLRTDSNGVIIEGMVKDNTDSYKLKIRDMYGNIEKLEELAPSKVTLLRANNGELFYRITDSLIVPESEIIKNKVTK